MDRRRIGTWCRFRGARGGCRRPICTKKRGSDTPLRRVLFRYHMAFIAQIMQSVACNGLHTVQERCCRWLLALPGPLDDAEVVITHEFLAQMLGVRRATMTDVLRPLQDEGLIRYRRGIVAVLDRRAWSGPRASATRSSATNSHASTASTDGAVPATARL